MANSIKNLVKIALAFFFLLCILAGCANAQAIDLSTDKAVLKQFGKLKNEKYGKDDVCIKRLKESAKIIVIGLKDDDSYCSFDGAFVNSRYYEQGDSDLSKIALAALGWEKANQDKREQLARLWVEKGILTFAPLTNQALAANSIGDGKIKVTASSKYPPGVRSRSVTKTFIFDKDGGLFSGGDY